jgi:hypothetical protein
MNRTFFAFLAAAVAALLITAPRADRQRGPVETGPGSLTAARKHLEGRWRLLSFEVIPPGKESLRVLGAGTLKYDGFGNLDVEIRVDAATAILLGAAGIRADDKGVISTRGRTALDLQNRTLTYILEGEPPLGAPSGPLALNRPRHWTVEHDTLTLVTKDDQGQTLSIGRWQKAP